MIPKGPKHRASRGFTHDKWPCCGEEPGGYGRPKASICNECNELIKLGKESVERSRLSGVKAYTWARERHWWPGYYGHYDFSNDGHSFRRNGSRDSLTDAMFALVGCLFTTAKDGDKYFRSIKTEGRLLECKKTRSKYDGTKAVLMNAETRDRLNDLDAAIRRALENVYKEGLSKGGSALLQLAAGDLTTHDFNRKIGLDEDD